MHSALTAAGKFDKTSDMWHVLMIGVGGGHLMKGSGRMADYNRGDLVRLTDGTIVKLQWYDGIEREWSCRTEGNFQRWITEKDIVQKAGD